MSTPDTAPVAATAAAVAPPPLQMPPVPPLPGTPHAFEVKCGAHKPVTVHFPSGGSVSDLHSYLLLAFRLTANGKLVGLPPAAPVKGAKPLAAAEVPLSALKLKSPHKLMLVGTPLATATAQLTLESAALDKSAATFADDERRHAYAALCAEQHDELQRLVASIKRDNSQRGAARYTRQGVGPYFLEKVLTGDLAEVEFVVSSKGCDPHYRDDRAVLYAVYAHDLRILKWLVGKHRCRVTANDYEAVNAAAQYARMDLLQYLVVECGVGLAHNTLAMPCAARAGHLHVVQWLEMRACPLTPSALYRAIDALGAEGTEGFVRDDDTSDERALALGKQRVFTQLIDHFLARNRTEGMTADAAYLYACQIGCLVAVQHVWARVHDPAQRGGAALTAACHVGDLTLVRWLHGTGKFVVGSAALGAASTAQHIDVVEYLLTSMSMETPHTTTTTTAATTATAAPATATDTATAAAASSSAILSFSDPASLQGLNRQVLTEALRRRQIREDCAALVVTTLTRDVPEAARYPPVLAQLIAAYFVGVDGRHAARYAAQRLALEGPDVLAREQQRMRDRHRPVRTRGGGGASASASASNDVDPETGCFCRGECDTSCLCPCHGAADDFVPRPLTYVRPLGAADGNRRRHNGRGAGPDANDPNGGGDDDDGAGDALQYALAARGGAAWQPHLAGLPIPHAALARQRRRVVRGGGVIPPGVFGLGGGGLQLPGALAQAMLQGAGVFGAQPLPAAPPNPNPTPASSAADATAADGGGAGAGDAKAAAAGTGDAKHCAAGATTTASASAAAATAPAPKPDDQTPVAAASASASASGAGDSTDEQPPKKRKK